MTDKTTKEISEKLKQARLAKGLTQFELADKAGIHSNTYAKIERAERYPSIDTLEKLVKVLGIKSSDIFPF